MKKIDTVVVGAAYVDKIDGIVVLLKDAEGVEYKHVMYSNEFKFEDHMDRVAEMKKLASMMTKKKIRYCYDENLDEHKQNAVNAMMNKWKQGD